MSGKYTILFAPVDAIGHFNACLGIAEQLRDRGHKVVFATPNGWKGKLSPQGFTEECYSTTTEFEANPTDQPSESWGDMISKMAPALAMDCEGQAKNLLLPMFKESLDQIKFCNPKLRVIVKKVKPDVIVIDWAAQQPALMDMGVPWILSMSISPIGISNKNVPPAFSGFPTDGDKSLWKKQENILRNLFSELYEDFKDWVLNNGGPELKYYWPLFLKYSPYANIYMYPMELDYTDLRPNPPNWYRFDTFVRTSKETFEIPDKLRNLPGKLVYFSMGTIGCCELGLMRKLIGILSKSPNRFIVSKGPMGDQLPLPDNMWGENQVPQTKVIPIVDLVITHGGNNTITESFYFGKRILVMPLFGDQPDNAQRIEETGLGLHFLPYKVGEDELLAGIEKLLADDLLEKRMVAISRRIQSTNSQAGAADIVENVARENKKV